MSHRLLLPKYKTVKQYEKTGNFAIRRYYRWPYRFFYRHKLRMILDMMDKGRIYDNALDFGCGRAEIFKPSLDRFCVRVKCVDTLADVKPIYWKFELIICGSILEFLTIRTTMTMLRDMLKPRGQIVGASPMDTWSTRLYFRLIGDKKKRKTHEEIMFWVRKNFRVLEYKEWFGLYFSFKARL